MTLPLRVLWQAVGHLQQRASGVLRTRRSDGDFAAVRRRSL